MAMDTSTEATEKVRRRNVAPSGPSFKLAGNESAAALGVVFATKLTVEPRENHFVILRVFVSSWCIWHSPYHEDAKNREVLKKAPQAWAVRESVARRCKKEAHKLSVSRIFLSRVNS